MMDFESGLETPPLSIATSTASQQDFFDQQSAITTQSFESFHSQLPNFAQQFESVDDKEVKKENVDTSQKRKENEKHV
jgi:hypothetical protein